MYAAQEAKKASKFSIILLLRVVVLTFSKRSCSDSQLGAHRSDEHCQLWQPPWFLAAVQGNLSLTRSFELKTERAFSRGRAWHPTASTGKRLRSLH